MAATSSKNTFSWTQETRLAVHALDTEFDFDVKQQARLFSLLFPEQFIHDGRMESRINAQSHQWKRLPPDCGPAWTSVLRPSVALATEREDMIVRIRKAAAEAGVSTDRLRSRQAAEKDTATSPGLASRKRAGTYWTPPSMDGESADELEFDITAPSPKRRKPARFIGQDHPQVQIYRSVAQTRATGVKVTINVPRTRKRPRSPTSAMNKISFQRLHALQPIRVLPCNAELAKQPLSPVPEVLAHPALRGLLFRYSEGNEEDPEYSEAAFVARKYRGKLNIHQEPPHCTNLEWQDLFYHFDPTGKYLGRGEGKQGGVLSPFISTSNAFWDTVNRALRESKRSGSAHARISVIDTTELDRRSVYHASPFYRELRKLHQYTGNGWKDPTLHEFLCYKEIPRKAIIKTIKLQHLLLAIERGPAISKVLRLNVFAMRGDFKSKIVPNVLRKANVKVDTGTVKVIAKLAHLLGLTAYTKPEHHSHVITDVVQGWGLRLLEATPDQWIELASSYARSIADLDNYILSDCDSQKLEWGFLDGARHGSSRQWNPRFPSNGKHDVKTRARRLGLSDPHRMLSWPKTSLSARKTIRSWQYKTTVRTAYAQVESTEEGSSEEIQVARPVRRAIATVPNLRKAFRETFEEEQIAYDSN